MASKVAPPSPGVDPPAPVAAVHPVQVPRAKPAPAGPQDSDVQLVIEEIGDTGRYVYTVLDRVSGRVIVTIPSSDVLRLMSEDSYAAGALFKSKV